MTKALTRQRRRIWLLDPHCHYCRVVTIFERPAHEPIPDNFATIDHLRPRHHPGRQEPITPGERRRVLACWRCNNDRDKRELAEKPRKWFYENGGAKPMSLKSLDELQWIVMKLEYDLIHGGKIHHGKQAKRRRARIIKSLTDVRNEIVSRQT